MTWQQQQLDFMRVALNESKRALPGCVPNPPVGCALVRGGVVVATGFTQPPYQPHAEPMALATLTSMYNPLFRTSQLSEAR